MKVLSLFNGISCGRVAFEQAKIDVERYVSYEIDIHANAIAKYNYPHDEYKGDATTADFTQYEGFDWVIGGSPCFGEGTLIYTDKGYKPIEEISIGDMVLTHKNRFRQVTNIGGKIAETVILEAQGIVPTVTTLNHPYYSRERTKKYKEETGGMIKALTDCQWKQVSELIPKTTHIAINQLQTNEDIIDISDEDLWILGRYVADGHNRMTKRPKRKNSFYYQVIISVGSQKLDAFKHKVKHRHFSCYKHSQSVFRCVFNSEYLCKLIKTMGFGEKAHLKTIPYNILNLPIERLKIFLDGYFSGDGHDFGKGMTCTTVSKTLASGLSLAILKVYGMSAKINLPKLRKHQIICGRNVKCRQSYNIDFRYKPSYATNGRLIEGQMWTSFKGVRPNGLQKVYNMSVFEDESYTANNAIVHNCTFWSISKKDRETTSEGKGFELFSHFARAIREVQPKYFLYENNGSIHKNIKKEITKYLGVDYTTINSSLLSAQNRKRCYWVGIRQADGTYRTVDIQQPEEAGLFVKDILMDESIPINTVKGKSHTITATYYKIAENPFSQFGSERGRQRVATPIRIGQYGKGGQGQRIYSVNGKSVCISANSGGKGGTTGLYKLDLPNGDYIIRKLYPTEAERLQTLPLDYTLMGDYGDGQGKFKGIMKVANINRYKAIGNGWTSLIIAHIIKEVLGN